MECNPFLDELLDLLNTVNRINRTLVHEEGRGRLMHLSAIQMQAIITIRRHGVMKMSELAAHLLVTRPQLTKVIDGLEEMGLIARKLNPDSRREVLIQLTDKGGHYIQESLLGKGNILSRVLANATDQDMEELRQAVRTMRRIFDKNAME